MTKDFDSASKTYDTAFTFSKIGKAQRDMVFKYLYPIIQHTKNLSVLELNCGTGEDAITLATLGHKVLATDISMGMISVAKAKTRSKNISFKIQDINTLDPEKFKEKFDFIFSNFGGFNCLSQQQIEAFFKVVPKLLNQNGQLVLVVMPKHCLWERLYFTVKGDFKKAKRRNTTNAATANVSGSLVNTWYYNPKNIERLSKSNFITTLIKPIGLTIPPSYLENSFLSHPILMACYKAIDKRITKAYWAKYADHFLIALTKI